MLVYRISKQKYIRDLSGTGAGLYGGRWNPPGINLLYTAGSISLACLEYLVNNFHVMGSTDICLAKIKVHKPAPLLEVDVKSLPHDWNETSYTPLSTQETGADFVKNDAHYLLKVPSAIVPDEFNLLLNPLHHHHTETVIEDLIDPFVLDERLFGR